MSVRMSLSVSPPVRPFIRLSVCSSICPSVRASVRLTMTVHLSVVHPSIRPSVCFVILSVHLFVHLPIRLLHYHGTLLILVMIAVCRTLPTCTTVWKPRQIRLLWYSTQMSASNSKHADGFKPALTNTIPCTHMDTFPHLLFYCVSVIQISTSSSPVVTTTSIILCLNKRRLTQVHLENGC